MAGSTVRIDDGVYSDVCRIRGLANVTITSASGRACGVVFDNSGQGNLEARKAMILVQNSPGFAAVGLRFKNVGLGGPAGVAQEGEGAGNQAGLRFEELTSAASARVSYCSFDGCVTGIFAPDRFLSLTIDHCDFGYEKSNGQSRDGLSHDAYLSALAAFTGVDNNWYGNLYANNCKTRALKNTIGGSYNSNISGRCVDIASGGEYAITGGIYVTGQGENHTPFNYGVENLNSGKFSGTISNITLRIATPNSNIWNNAAGTTMAFTNVRQEWYSSGGFNLQLRSPGAITGLVTSGPVTAAALPAPPAPVSGAACEASPSITSFMPTSGPVGTTVTVTGTGFIGATGATLSGAAVTNFLVLGATSATFKVLPGATSGLIAVIMPAGTSTSTSPFTVTAMPLRTTAGDNDATVQLYPNPARHHLTIRLHSRSEEEVRVEVRDVLARRVAGLTHHAAGWNDVPLSLEPLPSGIYLLTVQRGTKCTVRQLVVEP